MGNFLGNYSEWHWGSSGIVINTPLLSKPTLVEYSPQYHPNIQCKFCTTKFNSGETICYLRRQYWHRVCPIQLTGQTTNEKKIL